MTGEKQDSIIDERKGVGQCTTKNAQVRSPCGFMAKLKSIKHIEVIIAIVVIAVMALAYGLVAKKDVQQVSTVTEEQKLAYEIEKILSSIKGVGNADVLIVFNGGTKIEIASKVDKETNTTTDDGRTTVVENETKTPVMVGGKPFVLSESRADIDGVVVVAKGAKDMNVRLQITKAITALLGIEYAKVQVFEKV